MKMLVAASVKQSEKYVHYCLLLHILASWLHEVADVDSTYCQRLHGAIRWAVQGRCSASCRGTGPPGSFPFAPRRPTTSIYQPPSALYHALSNKDCCDTPRTLIILQWKAPNLSKYGKCFSASRTQRNHRPPCGKRGRSPQKLKPQSTSSASFLGSILTTTLLFGGAIWSDMFDRF